MKLNQVVAFASLRRDISLDFVRRRHARLVHKFAGGINRWAKHLACFDSTLPIELGRRSSEVHDRRHTMREVQRSIPKVCSRRCPWHVGRDMNVRIGQSRQQVQTGSVDENRIIWRGSLSNGYDPIAPNNHGLTGVDSLATHGNQIDVDERDRGRLSNGCPGNCQHNRRCEECRPFHT